MKVNTCSNLWRRGWLSLLMAAAMTGLSWAEAEAPVAPVNPGAKAGASAVVIVTNAAQLISLSLDDVPLAEVVRLFTRISGANIIAATTNLQGQVTANLQDVEWRPALESILERQNLQLTEKPPASGIFVIDTRKSSEDPRVSTSIRLNYAKVSDVATLVTSVLGKDGGSVSPFPAGNTIIVNASALKAAEIQKIVADLDRPRLQVAIETKIVQLNKGASENLGINWQGLSGESIALNGKSSGYTFNKVSGSIPPATIMPLDGVGTLRTLAAVLTPSDFNVVLAMLEGSTGSKLVSNPKIIVANEEKAIIKIATDQPNVKITQTQVTGSGGGTTFQTASALDGTMPFFTYGLTLEVTPRINTSSNITVTIKPELSALDPTLSETVSGGVTIKDGLMLFPDGNTFPVISKKSVETIFSLADGNTAAIGGLITTSDSDSTSKIPLLGDIPFLGDWFFSYKGRTRNQSELLLFVTVRLVDPKANMDRTQLPSETVLYMKSPQMLALAAATNAPAK